MSPAHPPDSIGRRIARVRKRRSLTQQGLADRCHYSRSHIAQVETGHKLATPSFVAAIAVVLGIDPAELFGQPYRGDTFADDQVHAPIAAIRRAIAFVDVAPELEAPPRSLDELACALSECQGLRRKAQHIRLGARLPALLEELAVHVCDPVDAQAEHRAWKLLFTAQDTAGELVRRLGYTDLANQLLERLAVTAQRTGEPHLPLMVARRRALLMAGVAAYGPALRLLRSSIDRVQEGRPGAAEAAGSLHLRAAVIAARGGQEDAAWNHYAQACETSRIAGARPLDTYGTNFVPGNIAIHGAAIAVELGDYEEAERRDAGIGKQLLGSVSPERRAHHGVDMARAHAETGRRESALRRLLAAERAAPQMVRYHPVAQSVVLHLGNAYRSMPEELRMFMGRMHLA
ncbi:helix-turn-helix transcriptional regulator [Nocardiopsis sp. CNT-189]|uniref:helix-turn-helix domain-containing protein n=1 Tax=Nocardiopsis oceanisediminis TaxID=2816862 RepID=UPI003B35AA49